MGLNERDEASPSVAAAAAADAMAVAAAGGSFETALKVRDKRSNSKKRSIFIKLLVNY